MLLKKQCNALIRKAKPICNANLQTLHWVFTWDPTQPIATRPLAVQLNGTWYTYGWDLTKNICEVYGQHGYIRTNYFYSPYGGVTTNGDVTQPIQWSAEFCDVELGLVYYNFRYYNCSSGRWIQRDGVHEMDNYNLYVYAHNSVPGTADYQGLWTQKGVLKIICCSKYKYNIDDFNLRGLVVISFSKATDVWKYDSGKIVYEDITARLHGNSSKNKIRINVNLNDTQAAKTLFHEIQHTDPILDSLGYLEEEVAVRIRTEQFAIDKKLPTTGKNYRKKQGKNYVPNEIAIRESVYNSSHYNPKGRRRIDRTYDGQIRYSNWKCPKK